MACIDASEAGTRRSPPREGSVRGPTGGVGLARAGRPLAPLALLSQKRARADARVMSRLAARLAARLALAAAVLAGVAGARAREEGSCAGGVCGGCWFRREVPTEVFCCCEESCAAAGDCCPDFERECLRESAPAPAPAPARSSTAEEEEEEEEEEEGLFKADAVNEEDSERARATQV